MTNTSTADPKGARDHARAMAGTRVEAMPTIPATAAKNLPLKIDPENLTWDETIAAGGYASRSLRRGTRLRLEDTGGDGCISLLVFNADHPIERLNVADTIKVQWNAYLKQGRLLLSDMGRVLMSIEYDDTDAFDPFCGASNRKTNAEKYGNGENYSAHPNVRDRFVLSATKHGLTRKDVHPCLNVFKPIHVGDTGDTEIDVGPFSPGRSIVLRCEMNVLVALANCPHVLDPRNDYHVTTVRATSWRGPVTPLDDPIRNDTPEGLRAFQNTEEYFR